MKSRQLPAEICVQWFRDSDGVNSLYANESREEALDADLGDGSGGEKVGVYRLDHIETLHRGPIIRKILP